MVATPIGNLGDMTLRALDVLRAVPLVAAEDTRMTRRLWARYEIDTRLVEFHAQSGAARERAAARASRGWRRPGAGHGRRHAAGQRPGRGPGRGLGGARRAGRANSRARRRCSRRWWQRLARRALELRRFPAAAAAGTGATLIERICADERADRPVRGARPRRHTLADLAAAAARTARGGGARADQAPRGVLARLAGRARCAGGRNEVRGEVTLVVAGAAAGRSADHLGAGCAG